MSEEKSIEELAEEYTSEYIGQEWSALHTAFLAGARAQRKIHAREKAKRFVELCNDGVLTQEIVDIYLGDL